MLVEAPLGNLQTAHERPSSIDWLDLTWTECLTRALRKQTRGGREIRILLRLGLTLHHEDVLCRDSDTAVVVNVTPCECLVIHPQTSAEFASVAFTLGDLHVPIELVDHQIVTPSDGPVEAAVAKLEVQYEVQSRRFQPTLRSASTFTLVEGFAVR